MDEATEQLQRVRTQTWVLNTVMMVYLFIWLPWGLTTWGPNRYSYGLSLPPGVLVSDHWSADHMFTMLLAFFFLVPWTLAFMTDGPRKVWRCYWVHYVALFVFFALSIVLLGIDIWHLSNANVATRENALNPANDGRWCCLYATLNPEACAPISATNPCTVVPPATALGTGFSFVWTFGLLIGWILLLLTDFLWTFYRFGRAVMHYEYVIQQVGSDLEAQRKSAAIELTKNQLPFHIKRQQELMLQAQQSTVPSLAANANKKYVSRSSKR